MRDAFDTDLLDWAKAVIAYTKQTQTNNTQLQKVISGTDDYSPGMIPFRIVMYGISIHKYRLVCGNDNIIQGNIPFC